MTARKHSEEAPARRIMVLGGTRQAYVCPDCSTVATIVAVLPEDWPEHIVTVETEWKLGR